jgi:hypothetical protein
LSVRRTETEKKRIWIWYDRKTAGNPIEQRWLDRTYAEGSKARKTASLLSNGDRRGGSDHNRAWPDTTVAKPWIAIF